MKKNTFILLVMLTSCFPSTQTGPEPHSIEFEEEIFEKIITYFNLHSEINHFDTETSTPQIDESIKKEMENIGFVEYRNLENYKVFSVDMVL